MAATKKVNEELEVMETEVVENGEIVEVEKKPGFIKKTATAVKTKVQEIGEQPTKVTLKKAGKAIAGVGIAAGAVVLGGLGLKALKESSEDSDEVIIDSEFTEDEPEVTEE